MRRDGFAADRVLVRSPLTYRVVGSVYSPLGAPGKKPAPCIRNSIRTESCRTFVMRMASFGHACAQAGASPTAIRLEHMSHFLTMPRRALYFGTPYGHFKTQYWHPMH